MTTAAQTLCIGTARAHNRHCLERCSHPRGAPVACTPGAGWKKGQGGRTQWATPAAACSCPGRAARPTPRSPPGLVKRAAPRPRREPGIPDVGAVTRHGFRKSSPMGGGRQWLPADSSYSINIALLCLRRYIICGNTSSKLVYFCIRSALTACPNMVLSWDPTLTRRRPIRALRPPSPWSTDPSTISCPTRATPARTQSTNSPSSPAGFVKLTGLTPKSWKLSKAALSNFNGLASWRNAENSLQSVNLTIPISPVIRMNTASRCHRHCEYDR